MSRRCVAPNCGVRGKKNVTLFKISSNPLRRDAWLKALNLTNIGYIPSSWRVCATHFDTDAWEKTREDGTRRLKENAVPTLFQPSSSNSSILEVPPPEKTPDHSYFSKKRFSTATLPENSESQPLSTDASDVSVVNERATFRDVSIMQQPPEKNLDHSYFSKKRFSTAILPENSGSQSLSTDASDISVVNESATFRDVSIMQQPSRTMARQNLVPDILLSNKICGDRLFSATAMKSKSSEEPALEEILVTPDILLTSQTCDNCCSAYASAINEEIPRRSLGLMAAIPKGYSQFVPILPKPS